MITEKCLVVYKNRPALVTGVGEKIGITIPGGEVIRVREKDVELLHPGPLANLAGLDGEPSGEGSADIRGAWELLAGSQVSLRELAELAYGVFSPQSAWAVYGLLQEGLYFTGTIRAIRPRTAGEVAAAEQKRAGKRQEQEERDAFLSRLKAGTLTLPQDSRFLQDVEALAYGKTGKSRTLRDMGSPETPEDAHQLLLRAGVWTSLVNPHPARFGLSLASAREDPGLPPDEERLDLTHLRAYAVDNAHSADPDDAVSIEGNVLYVHVADPAASILPGSPADIEARGRGATLYLPEGPSRMLAQEALPLYALGLQPLSPALSFKLTLNEDGSIAETEIIPSLVKVSRLTYADADQILAGAEDAGYKAIGVDIPFLREDLALLDALAVRNQKRREAAGAITIELPEVHIALSGERVSIEPDTARRSARMIRECMLLAGEGAGCWAGRQGLGGQFPYVCQEAGELPQSLLPGLAGSYQLRRCMRPRSLSIKPGRHWGLGLDGYTQVTSPLRRYTDLLAHQQIRAALGAGLYRDRAPLGEDELLSALAAGEAAAAAVTQADRASRAHWTAVYLADKKDSQWDGVALERRGARAMVMIPALGLETLIPPQGELEPNEPIKLALKSVKIPQAEAVFVPASSLNQAAIHSDICGIYR